MSDIINGILLGIGVCVPFGPVNILILSYAIKSFKNAFLLGLGATFGDIIYLTLLQFGILKFIDNNIFLNSLAIFGFLFLSYMALMMLKADVNLSLNTNTTKTSPFKNFIKGLLLNLSNPFVIAFWLSVATTINEASNPGFLFLGLIASIISWVFALSFFVYKYTHLFNAKILKIINISSAIILEYFAITLIIKRFFIL